MMSRLGNHPCARASFIFVSVTVFTCQGITYVVILIANFDRSSNRPDPKDQEKFELSLNPIEHTFPARSAQIGHARHVRCKEKRPEAYKPECEPDPLCQPDPFFAIM
jgi:hypothetical protein